MLCRYHIRNEEFAGDDVIDSIFQKISKSFSGDNCVRREHAFP